jgi:serine/threonine-protein kinase
LCFVTRSCPTCKRTFPDEIFFCGHDGTITVQDQDANDFDPRLGQQLGGYVVVARVADGAMGRVFEGRHLETRARVAIKVLHAEVARDQIAVERFKREYESAREMDHPNIVKVLEFGETPDASYFLTMEYLVGEELGRVLGKGRPISPGRTIRVTCQLARALDYAHSFGFIHRDLKPDNTFLCSTPDGDEVRILDFGSVKLQMETGAKLTAFGTTIGSPFYMSPEQAMGKSDVDSRTDVFAVGAMLYEMLTDKIAFDASNVAMILMRIMNESPPPPSTLNPECPPRMDDVIDRAIAKDKAGRYATVTELAQAMLKAYGLAGSVEVWAQRPQAEVERACLEATPPQARPYGQTSKAPSSPRTGATQVRSSTESRASAGSLVSSIPGLPRGGVSVGVMALIGLGLVAAGSALVSLMR